jgi:PAS domain S-box-containing protein
MAEKPTYEKLEKRIQELEHAEFDRTHAEEALRESEAHLRTLIETLPDLVWLKDPYGIYISCNPRFERFFGAKETAIKGKTDHDFVDKELADFFREKDRAAMAAGIPIINEEEVTYADDGHKELLETIKTPMYDSKGKLVGVLGIARDITKRKHAENLVRELSQTLMQAQERERKMISCELHDSIAQDLSTLKLYCNRLFETKSSLDSDTKTLSKDVSALINQTITTVRDLAYDLRPHSLDDLGLVSALEVFCEEFTEKNNTVVDFQAAGIHESTLNSDIQINLYRLVMEGLNNIRKHAAASKVIIRLVGASPDVILRIEDNGKGFDVKERERSTLNEKRMGLRSMKERVNLLQGQMSIHSQLNKGTEIVIKLPLKDKQ